MLEPAFDGVGVVGRVEKEQRRSVVGLDVDVEGIRLEDGIPPPPIGTEVGKPRLGRLVPVLLELDQEEMGVMDVVARARPFLPEPEVAQAADRLAVTGAGIDEDVRAPRRREGKGHQRGEAGQKMGRRREVPGQGDGGWTCHGG